MAKKKEQIIEDEIIETEGESSAIFLRKVDVIICNGENEEPTIIKADEQ